MVKQECHLDLEKSSSFKNFTIQQDDTCSNVLCQKTNQCSKAVLCQINSHCLPEQNICHCFVRTKCLAEKIIHSIRKRSIISRYRKKKNKVKQLNDHYTNNGRNVRKKEIGIRESKLKSNKKHRTRKVPIGIAKNNVKVSADQNKQEKANKKENSEEAKEVGGSKGEIDTTATADKSKEDESLDNEDEEIEGSGEDESTENDESSGEEANENDDENDEQKRTKTFIFQDISKTLAPDKNKSVESVTKSTSSNEVNETDITTVATTTKNDDSAASEEKGNLSVDNISDKDDDISDEEDDISDKVVTTAESEEIKSNSRELNNTSDVSNENETCNVQYLPKPNKLTSRKSLGIELKLRKFAVIEISSKRKCEEDICDKIKDCSCKACAVCKSGKCQCFITLSETCQLESPEVLNVDSSEDGKDGTIDEFLGSLFKTTPIYNPKSREFEAITFSSFRHDKVSKSEEQKVKSDPTISEEENESNSKGLNEIQANESQEDVSDKHKQDSKLYEEKGESYEPKHDSDDTEEKSNSNDSDEISNDNHSKTKEEDTNEDTESESESEEYESNANDDNSTHEKIKDILRILRKLKKKRPSKKRLIDNLYRLAKLEETKINVIFRRLRKHLSSSYLIRPKKKAKDCLRDLLNWATTAILLGNRHRIKAVEFELNKALDPEKWNTVDFFRVLGLKPKRQRKVKGLRPKDCDTRLCPKMHKACPKYGGMCAVFSEDCPKKKKCVCRIMISCKTNTNRLNIVVKP